MLADPKSRALAEDFAGQWLRVGNLAELAEPDKRLFPEYTPELRDAMVEEAIAFFHAILREDRPVLELLDSDYTYLNERLAQALRHRGGDRPRVPPGRAEGPQPRRRARHGGGADVDLVPEADQPGAAGQVGARGAARARPRRPRRRWSRRCRPTTGSADGMTFRQRLEQHRKDADCASCHARLDPLGFGLENFDVARPLARPRSAEAGRRLGQADHRRGVRRARRR